MVAEHNCDRTADRNKGSHICALICTHSGIQLVKSGSGPSLRATIGEQMVLSLSMTSQTK